MCFSVGSLEMKVNLVTKLASYLAKLSRQTRAMVLLRRASSQETVDGIVHDMQSKGWVEQSVPAEPPSSRDTTSPGISADRRAHDVSGAPGARSSPLSWPSNDDWRRTS